MRNARMGAASDKEAIISAVFHGCCAARRGDLLSVSTLLFEHHFWSRRCVGSAF
jgi:hypothetical protein